MSKDTKKKYYSVRYIKWGMDAPRKSWFDSLQDAQAFASGDYRDGVVLHRVSKPSMVAKYAELVELSASHNNN